MYILKRMSSKNNSDSKNNPDSNSNDFPKKGVKLEVFQEDSTKIIVKI